MKTIRQGMFETNSSSMHAIVINRDSYRKRFNADEQIVFDLDIDFSDRTLILRDSKNEKASYIFHLICDGISEKLPNHYGKKFSDDELKIINDAYSSFEDLLEDIEDFYKEEEGLDIKFINYRLDLSPEDGYAKIYAADEWPSLGCYGHKSFMYELDLFRVIDTMTDYIYNEYHANNDEDKKKMFFDDFQYCFSYILDFISDDGSVIIQGSDEMNDDEMKKQRELIVEYVKKDDGAASVIWPVGG